MVITIDNSNYGALSDFSNLKNKLYVINYPIHTNEVEEYLALLFNKIKLHIWAINFLLSQNLFDSFSIIPLARVCMETFCIISYIKGWSDINERNFRWLVWMRKSYTAIEEWKYDFTIFSEWWEIFDNQITKYEDLLFANQSYKDRWNPALNSKLYKEIPGYEKLYKDYFPNWKFYNQLSWVTHPSAIWCTQMKENRPEKLMGYSNVIAFELNMLIARMIHEYMPDDNLVIWYSTMPNNPTIYE